MRYSVQSERFLWNWFLRSNRSIAGVFDALNEATFK
jgi:hypothetical protein